MEDYSLLAYLGPRLTQQTENLATDSLFYLLRRYKTVSTEFLQTASELGLNVQIPISFDTQVTMIGGEIPDLVGRTEDDKNVLLVESKFWAPLTPNQPISYLERLSGDSDGMVIILGPASRYHTLWSKVLTRCKEAGLHPTDEIGSPPDLLSVRLNPHVRLGYLSWGYLLERFQAALDNEGNSRGSNEVWQLRSLTQRLDAEAFQPFRPEELIAGSDRRIAQLKTFIDTLVTKLNEAGHIDLEGYRATPGPGYYRRYFTFLGRINWYIEYNLHKSQQLGISLLLLGGPNIDDLAISSQPYVDITNTEMIEHHDEVLIPLNLLREVEEDVVIRSLFDQVESVARIIRQAHK